MTTRRTVFAGIAAALMPGPLAAQVPTQGGMRRLGVLMTTLATDPAGLARAAAFVQGARRALLEGGRQSAHRLALGRRRPFAVRALRG